MRFSDQAQSVGHAVHEAIRFVAQRTRQLLPPPLWLPTPGNRRFLAAKATLVRFIRDRICNHGDGAHDTPAMLAALQQAQDPVTGQRMSDAELIDELITLVIAGHETSAVALTWTLCLLGRNPEAEAQLQRELDAVLAGRLPTLADVPALTYTAASSTKRCGCIRRPGSSSHLPAGRAAGRLPYSQGSMILVCPYLTHRLPEYFPQPERFLPDRFGSEDAPARPDMPIAVWGRPAHLHRSALRDAGACPVAGHAGAAHPPPLAQLAAASHGCREHAASRCPGLRHAAFAPLAPDVGGCRLAIRPRRARRLSCQPGFALWCRRPFSKEVHMQPSALNVKPCSQSQTTPSTRRSWGRLLVWPGPVAALHRQLWPAAGERAGGRDRGR